jgi:hypothetical protein
LFIWLLLICSEKKVLLVVGFFWEKSIVCW